MSDKTVDFNYFLEQIKKAAAKIDSHYFQLPVVGRVNPAFLERVYCYELYHQLRCFLKDDFLYKLDGEVDKTGNPEIRSALGPKKPDFIVHVPGDMRRNLAVIEVKPIKARPDNIRKDLGKLEDFLDKASYYKAIMLIYGSSKNCEDKIRRIRHDIDSLHTEYSERILLLWHKKPGKQSKVI